MTRQGRHLLTLLPPRMRHSTNLKSSRLIEQQTRKRIKTLRSNNGGKYTSHAFEKYLRENGIQHQKSTPYMPEQNGVTEQTNHTIIERARCMLFERDINMSLWAEAMVTSAYLKNHSPMKALANMMPEEAWIGKK